MAKVHIDPLSRIEGHLSIELDVRGSKVVGAKSKGDMFRGFENILIGRNPVDANLITQRICGVCPISHAIASSKCLESAFKIQPTKNGIILRNLILAANYLQSHILHFYHLSALDFVDIKAILSYSGKDEKLNALKTWAAKDVSDKTGPNAMLAVSPFLPRYEGKDFYIKDVGANISAIANYVKALDIRMKTHKMVALFAGKVPHAASILPGGVSEIITSDKIKEYKKLLKEVTQFVKNSYFKDVITVAKAYKSYFSQGGFNTFLSYGAFEQDYETHHFFRSGILVGTKLQKFDPENITEQVKYARFSSRSKLHPAKGETVPSPNKPGAYSWVKAPRYQGIPCEVGPLARIMINYYTGHGKIKNEVTSLTSELGIKLSDLNSTMGRHAARAIEAKVLCEEALQWLSQLDKKKPSRNDYRIPDHGEGVGLTEAPRGALGHWISIKNYKISRYQCVVPTTWNISPKDDAGVSGVVEQALKNVTVTDKKNPIEAARVVRSFDPCLACAIHILNVEDDSKIFPVC